MNLVPEQVLASIQSQQELFYRVFPGQVEVGTKKPRTFQWLLGRTKDATGATAPRELIHLLNAATELQLQQLEIGEVELPGETLYSKAIFKEALKPVSKVRLEQTLYAEYPSLKQIIQQLERQKATQSLQSLQELWGLDESGTRKAAARLEEVGFFETRGTREAPEYWIPLLYRDALKLVQGKAEGADEASEGTPDA
jgi:hypothetical protein